MSQFSPRLYNLAVTALVFRQALILLNTHAKFENNRPSLTGRKLCPHIQKRNKIFHFFPLLIFLEVKSELHLEQCRDDVLPLWFCLKVKK